MVKGQRSAHARQAPTRWRGRTGRWSARGAAQHTLRACKRLLVPLRATAVLRCWPHAHAPIPLRFPLQNPRPLRPTRPTPRVPRPAPPRLNVSFDVVEGRDIDFGIMLVPDGEEAAIALYGPSRRCTKLQTSIPVPATGAVHLGFDTSYTWISSKLVRYTAFACADEIC